MASVLGLGVSGASIEPIPDRDEAVDRIVALDLNEYRRIAAVCENSDTKPLASRDLVHVPVKVQQQASQQLVDEGSVTHKMPDLRLGPLREPRPHSLVSFICHPPVRFGNAGYEIQRVLRGFYFRHPSMVNGVAPSGAQCGVARGRLVVLRARRQKRMLGSGPYVASGTLLPIEPDV